MSEEIRYRMKEDETVVREGGEEESKCARCEKKEQACISFFAHENAMMHKDVDNERLHETIREQAKESNRRNLCLCATFIVIILLFVVTYTIRTNIWNETVRNMTAAIVELANAKGITVP